MNEREYTVRLTERELDQLVTYLESYRISVKTKSVQGKIDPEKADSTMRKTSALISKFYGKILKIHETA